MKEGDEYKKIKNHWFRNDLDPSISAIGKVKKIKTGEILEIKWMFNCPVVILSDGKAWPVENFQKNFELIKSNTPLTTEFESNEMRINTTLGLTLPQIREMKDYFIKHRLTLAGEGWYDMSLS